MERPFTLKNSLKNVSISEELIDMSDTQFEPSNKSIKFLLDYSKALNVEKTESIGDVFTILN
jgi:hypothetical protein